jgi:hypothetical protein
VKELPVLSLTLNAYDEGIWLEFITFNYSLGEFLMLAFELIEN